MTRSRARIAMLSACGLLLSLLSATPAASTQGRCGDPAERPWCDTSLPPDERASLLLDELTRDEKISLLAGDELMGALGREGTHTGTSNGIERVGLPTVYFTDGPVGVRQGKATGMPSPMAVAASFDPATAARHAAVVGDEAKHKGNDVVYAPGVNILRTPLNGRTFEYYGEDPYLTSRLAVGWISEVQRHGVIGNVKHFAVNNQEGIGFQPPGAPVGVALIGSRLTVNAVVDERTLREIYLPHFEAAVKEARVGTVMCAYNRINGQYGCENQHLLSEILKDEWGFDGFVLTDYGAAKNTAASLNNGLDLDIYPGFVYSPLAVQAALAFGQASEAAVDEHVHRILRTLFAYSFFDRPAHVDDTSQIDQAAHNAAAAEVEERGIVLLRNDGRILPLDAGKLGRVAVIGPEADVLKDGGGSSAIDEFTATTPLQGIRARVGADRVVHDDGSDAARAADVAHEADVAVVVVGDRMTEGNDKTSLGLNADQLDGIDRDQLIERVAAAQPNTVVVLQSGGPVLTPWRGEVPGLLEMWYPGQNGGTALARVLFGDADPGGRLPATFPRTADQLPTANNPEAYPGVAETAKYSEGVFIGYRHYDRGGLDPAYPFGHGLSYTDFAYGDPVIRPAKPGSGRLATVSVSVTNTGDRAGTAVPQLYLGLPAPRESVPQPPQQLKGFQRLELSPGQTKRVDFPLDARALSYWDAGWRIARGCYQVLVGNSSRDIQARAVLAHKADCGPRATRVN